MNFIIVSKETVEFSDVFKPTFEGLFLLSKCNQGQTNAELFSVHIFE